MDAESDETIDEFLAVLPELRGDELRVLAAAHHRVDRARGAAWQAARVVIAQDHLGSEVERLRSLVTGWATRSVSGATQWAEITMANGLMEQDARRAAAPALLDAAIALFLGEALDSAHRDVLLGPWRRLSQPEPSV
jgi:hypothetical protein